MKAKMNYMEQKLEKHDKDHDLLVSISVKINIIMDTLGIEIKKRDKDK